MRPPTRLRQGFLGAAPQLRRRGRPFGHDLRQDEAIRALPPDHDQVDAARQELGKPAEAFTAQPLHAVARHGVAELARHHDPQTSQVWPPRSGTRSGTRQVGPQTARSRGNQEDEMRRSYAPSARLDAQEVRAFAEPALA